MYIWIINKLKVLQCSALFSVISYDNIDKADQNTLLRAQDYLSCFTSEPDHASDFSLFTYRSWRREVKCLLCHCGCKENPPWTTTVLRDPWPHFNLALIGLLSTFLITFKYNSARKFVVQTFLSVMNHEWFVSSHESYVKTWQLFSTNVVFAIKM